MKRFVVLMLFIILCCVPGLASAALVSDDLRADEAFGSYTGTGWSAVFDITANEDVEITGFWVFLNVNLGSRGCQIDYNDGSAWVELFNGSLTHSGWGDAVTLDSTLSMIEGDSYQFQVTVTDGLGLPLAYVDSTDSFADDNIEISKGTFYTNRLLTQSISDVYWYGGVQYEYDDGTTVPIPSTFLLMGAGLLAFVGLRRRTGR